MEAHPRYMEPRKGPSQAAIMAMTPTREYFPSNAAFSSVNPRYMEPRSPRPDPVPRGLEECTFDVRKHRENVGARYSGLQTRYMEIKPVDPEQSPRRLVEKKIDETKRERALWRGDTVSGKYSTFDDLMRQTKKVEETVPKPRPVSAPSRVAQYLLHGTASCPYPNGDNSRRNTPTRNRDGSPARSPRNWHSAGVDCSSFSAHEKDTSNQTWFVRQEKRVKELTERRNSIRVSPNHVPRVAGLAVAEQVKRELEMSKERSSVPQSMYALDGEADGQPEHPPTVTPILRFRTH